MKKLYVGNLAWAVADEDLQSLFSEHGSVASAS
ncbi:MAG TPA: RNA-binding protein, partial [Gammaproteobacteria bacterium]|nr:RNA-binding protein [Gammaproteobacteria bacterium]